MGKLFDAHNHLQDDRLKPYRDKALKADATTPPYFMAVNGTSIEDWPHVELLARAFPQHIFPQFGLHPWKVADTLKTANTTDSTLWLERLEDTLDRFPQAGIGECGLDRWIRPSTLEWDAQHRAFTAQLHLATSQNRPITIHCLKAIGALIDILKSHPLPERGVLIHSLSASSESLRELLKLNTHFSISPYFFTAKKATQLELFKKIPPSRLHLETDAPDMRGPAALFPTHIKDFEHNDPEQIRALYQLSSRYFDLPQKQFFENSWKYFAT